MGVHRNSRKPFPSRSFPVLAVIITHKCGKTRPHTTLIQAVILTMETLFIQKCLAGNHIVLSEVKGSPILSTTTNSEKYICPKSSLWDEMACRLCFSTDASVEWMKTLNNTLSKDLSVCLQQKWKCWMMSKSCAHYRVCADVITYCVMLWLLSLHCVHKRFTCADGV